MTKKIDINQRIPIHALKVGLQQIADTSYDKEYILEQLKVDFSGENRLVKAQRIVNKILIKNKIAECYSNSSANATINKSINDQHAVILAMLCSGFSFAFDVISEFGRIFKVQDIVSSELINKKLSAVYGSNRATANGLYSVIPMFMELGLFNRVKQGLYSFQGKKELLNPLSKELIIICHLLNTGLKQISIDELYQIPFLYFFDFYDIETTIKKFNILELSTSASGMEILKLK